MSDTADRGSPRRGPDRVALAVAGLALLALLTRFVALGDRPFHWDEGRVGYWTLRYLDTGAYSYRPAAGGPFLYLVNRHVFALVGASDASARAVVALVGGLFPLAALLFRGTLREDETVALAGLLAFEPLLLYYSRFLRGDLPAAAFGFVAVGGAVRYRRTGERRALYLAAAAVALALSASGFAVAYPLLWLAAGLLVVDEARVRGAPGAIRSKLGGAPDRLDAQATPFARALFVFLAAFLFLFAPRAGGMGPGLYDLGTFPEVVTMAFAGSAESFSRLRVVARLAPAYPGGSEFLPAVVGYVRTLVATSWPLVALGLVGFLYERYRRDARGVVAFGAYFAGLGTLLFAVASTGSEPWSVVHVLPALALPGAVALAAGVRLLVRRADAADPARLVTVLLVVAVVAAGAGTAVGASYAAPEPGSPFSQFAQPVDDPEPMLAAAERAMAGDAEGPDVVYVGEELDTTNEYERPPVEYSDQAAWGARLPLQWYFERLDADVTSVREAGQITGGDPPVVVTKPAHRVAVDERLGDGYEQFDLRLGLWNRDVVVYVAR
ncbi:flippase activity-associated protein Agl23 [Halorarum salinum]|uniref:TIGR03663 family protein n=1 Tax=Halorarum salinum TaxID=2743089 RepID=A0A7D5QBU8_9EURY|nr:flippase activity-associated protein Agl23 [Halobaculum salinum]QLG62140.1 TIGR03663 family protein [Halobaculum salinum]